MDFHLLQRVRSQTAQESLKKLKRPKVKLTSPKWTNDENASAKKRPRVFFPEGDEESTSSEEKEEKDEETDVSDFLHNISVSEIIFSTHVYMFTFFS